ncbi:MAG: YgiQ family radical SAM protein [Spirochaetaceae bacterium]|nr:MAG: YgiQ family radical SAM protein [Spirochaetaceae bacterium]
MDDIEQYRADRRDFLPISWSDIEQRGWDTHENPLDFVIVSGDAYVDHPSFAAAVIGRVLEAAGYRVGIIAQPEWRSPDDFRRLGRPRLAFLVSAGNVDSMVANYTVSGKPRRRDSYSPGAIGGRRPDRATLVYCTRIREAFKNTDIVIGGIEASLRRLAHFDYWSDRMRRSILLDSKADLLVYGMGESPILEIAAALSDGRRAAELTTIAGTVRRCRTDELPAVEAAASEFGRVLVELPDWDSFADPENGKRAYAQSFRQQQRNTDAINGAVLVERYGPALVVQNPAAPPRTGTELDVVYELPYTRTFHPDYIDAGGVPAIEEVRFSLVSNRGCFGGCSFCALAFHQGRCVTARSISSLEREARLLTALSGFKGYIHDVGGPTANFRRPSCTQQLKNGVCKDKQCLHPKACGNLEVDHDEYLDVLRRLREIPGVKKVFVRSGIRYDYVLLDSESPFLRELTEHHVSGQLKVAPEHISPRALAAMGKPGVEVYDRFAHEFRRMNEEIGSKQYLVPYFISSHPGTTLSDAILLAEYFRDHGGTPEQVQDFYPTPGTLATCMYYTETDPRTGVRLPVPKSAREKAMQRALLQFRDPKNYALVREALETAGREDLIGTKPTCLIAPAPRPTGRRPPTGGSADGRAPKGKRRSARSARRR